MENIQVCTQCYQSIKSPICAKCQTRQLALWLDNQGVNPRIIVLIISRVKSKIPSTIIFDKGDICLICNEELLSLCQEASSEMAS